MRTPVGRSPVEWQANTPEGEYAPVDFYGGTLRGIADRLPYLQKLGVTVLYLNPIFESVSNHRYDTGDYRKVDPILGTNTDFKKLCAAAGACGIRIVLDGVFAHTGADSRYFNRFRHYPGCGAYNSSNSVYARWYDFAHYPNDYRCWWNFRDLPAINTANPDWRKYMITGEHSVVKAWLHDGASGWRLDVADELPDDVLRDLRTAAKQTDPDSVLLGEVWEDAVTKVSYGAPAAIRARRCARQRHELSPARRADPVFDRAQHGARARRPAAESAAELSAAAVLRAHEPDSEPRRGAHALGAGAGL